MGINNAQALVRKTADLPIPIHLRNAPTELMKELDYGKDYMYAHDYPGNFVYDEFLPEEIMNTKLYDPGDNVREAEMRNRLRHLWGDKYGY